MTHFSQKATAFSTTIFMVAVLFAVSCKRSGPSGGFDILGPVDETAEAGKLVASANEDLTKIKVLYVQNEDKRQKLKEAMEKNDAVLVKKIAEDVLYLIGDGKADGENAIKKIQDAQEMQINSDYREYLRLKEESLKLEIEAFTQYQQAAKILRDGYDPKNAAAREKVKSQFKTISDNYRTIMEKARDRSNQANEVAKEARKKQAS